ncbi:MAG: SIMPL domain-containing protein [Patescibacteria group bacterium]
MNKNTLFSVVLGVLISGLLLFASSLILPWDRVNWGNLAILPGKTVTVTGTAESKERTQVANFTAGVQAVNDNKETAVAEVNQKMEAIVSSVKEFGVKPEDIQTQNMSIYQRQDTYYEGSTPKSRPGQWDISNSITITLRNINKASELTDLLTKSGATNVYGPNFTLEDTKNAEEKLLRVAMEDAKKKAEILAQASGRKLGKVTSVTEGFGGTAIPVFSALREASGDAPTEPGSQTVSKTVTVTFSLN